MEAPTDLRSRVLDRIAAGAPRTVWTPADFLDLAGREAVDKTLQRLVKADALRRIDRGLYDRPGFNTLTQRPNPADPREVIEAVARRDQVRVLVDGLTAANDLGFTNAVPAKIVVHVDARLRPIRLGDLEIKFRPTAASKLYWASRPAMRVVQALHWLRDLIDDRPEAAEDVRRRLLRLLDAPGSGPALREDLSEGLSTLPAWMQAFLRPLLSASGAGA